MGDASRCVAISDGGDAGRAGRCRWALRAGLRLEAENAMPRMLGPGGRDFLPRRHIIQQIGRRSQESLSEKWAQLDAPQ